MKRKIILFLLFITVFSGYAQNPYFYLQSVSSYPTIEGTAIGYKLTISGVISTNVSANVSTSTDSSTASDSDFTALNTTVTIQAGEINSNVFYIYTTNDNLPESNEYFKLSVLITSDNTSNLNTETLVFITDDDNIPALYVSNLSKYEGQGYIYVTYNLTNPYHSNIDVHSVTNYGSAMISDFTAINSTFTIPAGQTQYSISIAITDDLLIESDETFVLESYVTSGNTTNSNLSNTMTIKDNDTTPTISMASINQCSEGQTKTITAYLNRPYNSNVVVSFMTVSGTASSSDFTSISIVQTILSGNTSVSVSIPTNDDIIDEPVETFTINGTITSGNTSNSSISAVVSIFDNDGLPDLKMQGNDGQVFEGSDYKFWISLSSVSALNTVINVATSSGTADSTDFTVLNTMVTIPAGEYGIPFSIPTTLDAIQEGTENFIITATNLNGTTFNSSESIEADIYDNYNIHTQSDNIFAGFGDGGNYSLIANDYFHGTPLTVSDATFTMSSNSIGATINAQGEIIIPASTPIGGYDGLNYTACETVNPSNCSTSYIVLYVVSPLKALLTTSYVDLNGDGFTNAGDVVHIVYTISNIGNTPITNIYFDSAYGLSNYTGGPLTSLGAGESDTTTFSGNYIISQNDITTGIIYPNYYSVFKGTYNNTLVTAAINSQNSINPPSPIILNVSNGLKLNAFIDSNSNTVQDGLEINFPYGNYDYSINGGVVHNIYSSTHHYLYESDPSSAYNLTYNIDAPYYAYNTCLTSYFNVTVPAGSGITTKNFTVNAAPYQDLSVYLIPYSSPRPGVVYNNDIIIKNYSNQLVNSGIITFVKDSAVEITNISQTGTIATSTGFTFNFADLLPYETRHILVEMLVPSIPIINLGNLLTNSVSINTPLGDILPLNNNSNLSQIIIGSYDPNSIDEAHGEQILHSSFSSNDYLTYTIRFENTGTANASFVKITDNLDDKLEPSSLRMITASENYVLDRIDAALVWKFNEINLPPSNGSSTNGHGFVTFQIKPKPGYAVGDVISSIANIYFDTNPPITTNICNTTFVNLLSNENLKFENLKYFPNPVKNIFSLSNNYIIENVSVLNILGQTILNKKINEFQTYLDLSNLSNGVYLIKILSKESEKTIKIVKE